MRRDGEEVQSALVIPVVSNKVSCKHLSKIYRSVYLLNQYYFSKLNCNMHCTE